LGIFNISSDHDIHYLFNRIKSISINLNIDIKDDNYKVFKKGINELETVISGMTNTAYRVFIHEYRYDDNLSSSILNILRNGNLFETIEKIVSPDNFKLFDWNQLVDYVKHGTVNHEVWTDSECIFIADTSKNRKLLKENFSNIKYFQTRF
jgi:hypothetical protein